MSRCQILRIKIGKKKCPGTQYSSYDRLEVLIWTRLKSAFRKRLDFSNILSNMEDTAIFHMILYDIDENNGFMMNIFIGICIGIGIGIAYAERE